MRSLTVGERIHGPGLFSNSKGFVTWGLVGYCLTSLGAATPDEPRNPRLRCRQIDAVMTATGVQAERRAFTLHTAWRARAGCSASCRSLQCVTAVPQGWPACLLSPLRQDARGFAWRRGAWRGTCREQRVVGQRLGVHGRIRVHRRDRRAGCDRIRQPAGLMAPRKSLPWRRERS